MPDKPIVQAQRESVAAIHVAAVRESTHDLADVVEQPFMISIMIRIRIIMLIARDLLFEGERGADGRRPRYRSPGLFEAKNAARTVEINGEIAVRIQRHLPTQSTRSGGRCCTSGRSE